MAVMDVVLYPDAPLKDVAKPFESVGPEVVTLAQDMIETMHAHEGVGLAGPQVGISKRIFVLQEPDKEPMCFINPELSEMEGKEFGEEGCLSMPRVYGQVPRATRVRVKALDEHGKPVEVLATDFFARIIQHENDHLDGIMFPERMNILSRDDMYQQWEGIRESILAARAGLDV